MCTMAGTQSQFLPGPAYLKYAYQLHAIPKKKETLAAKSFWTFPSHFCTHIPKEETFNLQRIFFSWSGHTLSK